MPWLPWIHDVSQSALAAAVASLGLVLLLELRSVVQLRRTMDRNLARVFEQLDLLRFENQQLLEGQLHAESPAPTPVSLPEAIAPAAVAVPAAPPTERSALPSGEARLLASLAEARARRQGAANS